MVGGSGDSDSANVPVSKEGSPEGFWWDLAAGDEVVVLFAGDVDRFHRFLRVLGNLDAFLLRLRIVR